MAALHLRPRLVIRLLISAAEVGPPLLGPHSTKTIACEAIGGLTSNRGARRQLDVPHLFDIQYDAMHVCCQKAYDRDKATDGVEMVE